MRHWKWLVSWAVLAALSGQVAAADLPPEEQVLRVLRQQSAVQAGAHRVQAEEAHRSRLEAGVQEWSLRLGSQRRRVSPTAGQEAQAYQEWDAAVERPLRWFGKQQWDGALGAAGVAWAEAAQGDALHEAARVLLQLWFNWQREVAAETQWGRQCSVLEQQRQAVRRRHQLGDASRMEGVLAEAALTQAEAQWAQARLKVQLAAGELRRRFAGLTLPEMLELSAPQPPQGQEEHWLAEVLEHNHELAMASAETRKGAAQAGRAEREQMPDPTFGVQVARERSGEERLLGAYVSIPLPGEARRLAARAALAEAAEASSREAAVRQRIENEAQVTVRQAFALPAQWQQAQRAAEQLGQAADMLARAYQLGEGGLSEVLAGRRLAHEAELAAVLARIEALVAGYRLQLDAHRLWRLEAP